MDSRDLQIHVVNDNTAPAWWKVEVWSDKGEMSLLKNVFCVSFGRLLVDLLEHTFFEDCAILYPERNGRLARNTFPWFCPRPVLTTYVGLTCS